MPLVAGDIVSVTFRYTGFGQRCMNVLHYECFNTGSLDTMGDLQRIASFFADTTSTEFGAGAIKALIPVSYALDEVRVQKVSPQRTAFRAKAIGEVGSKTATDSINFAVAITKRSDSGARGNSTTFFLPGLSPDLMDEGLLLGTYANEVKTKMDWLRGSVSVPDTGTLSLDPVIWSNVTNDRRLITGLRVQPEVRVMTRRTVGRGE